MICEHRDVIGDWCRLTEGSGARVVCWVAAYVGDKPDVEQVRATEQCAYRRMAAKLKRLEAELDEEATDAE